MKSVAKPYQCSESHFQSNTSLFDLFFIFKWFALFTLYEGICFLCFQDLFLNCKTLRLKEFHFMNTTVNENSSFNQYSRVGNLSADASIQ